LEKLLTLAEAATHDATIGQHLLRDGEELPWTEIEPSIELFSGCARSPLLRRWGYDSALTWAPRSLTERLPRKPSVLDRLTKQLRSRIGSRDRHLNRVGIDVTGEANRLLIVSRVSPGNPRMNVP